MDGAVMVVVVGGRVCTWWCGREDGAGQHRMLSTAPIALGEQGARLPTLFSSPYAQQSEHPLPPPTHHAHIPARKLNCVTQPRWKFNTPPPLITKASTCSPQIALQICLSPFTAVPVLIPRHKKPCSPHIKLFTGHPR